MYDLSVSEFPANTVPQCLDNYLSLYEYDPTTTDIIKVVLNTGYDGVCRDDYSSGTSYRVSCNFTSNNLPVRDLYFNNTLESSLSLNISKSYVVAYAVEDCSDPQPLGFLIREAEVCFPMGEDSSGIVHYDGNAFPF